MKYPWGNTPNSVLRTGTLSAKNDLAGLKQSGEEVLLYRCLFFPAAAFEPATATGLLAKRLRMDKAAAIPAFRKLGLSRREADVLLWIARGQSNVEIGASLRISPRTVKKHLEHIFDKLGVSSRLAAAVRAGAVYSAKSALSSSRH